jgi:heme-binding protein
LNTTGLAKRTGAGLLLLLGLSQLARPSRTNPPVDPRKTLATTEHPPAPVAALLDRSCGDCHTNSTKWPWYTEVAPISWWIVDHVNEGRRRASFSDWADYDESRRLKELNEVCKRVERRNMPLESYLLVHRDAQLSDQERQAICDWTRTAAAVVRPDRP